MDLLIISGIDITHFRLVDLTRLADQAKAFYDWVEIQFQVVLNDPGTLDEILRAYSEADIYTGIKQCYEKAGSGDMPFLFDGIGRSYSHSKACYYFFSWLIRDAPQQRLAPLIQKIMKNSGRSRLETEAVVLAALIYKYRDNVKTFSWDAIREVIIDRLEGSRRSIKGHEKETIVRTALIIALQSYFQEHGN